MGTSSIPRGERMPHPRHYTDAYGVRISYYVWNITERTPRGVVQLLHGVGEHAGRYLGVVEALTDAGFTVYADDHRGHGQTGFEQHGGDLDRMGKLGPGGLRATIDAVVQLSALIREENPGRPLVLLGHSWGSFMAQKLVNAHPHDYDALILSGTSYLMPGYLNGGDLNKRHQRPGGTPVEWLSRDPEVAEAFMADPYTTSVPLLKLFGVRDAARLFGRPAKSLPESLPLLIQVGGDDPVGGERSARRLAESYIRRSGLRDVTLIVYPGARHEVFHETNSPEVRADLLGWLDERLPARE